MVLPSQHFVDGNRLRGFLDGTTMKLTDGDKLVATWSQNNSKVVNWIHNSIESNISVSLQAFKKASDMWNRMKLYHQANKARRIHLDTELAKYNGHLTSWNEIDSMILSDVATKALSCAMKAQNNALISYMYV